jgi:hypothetical protein
LASASALVAEREVDLDAMEAMEVTVVTEVSEVTEVTVLAAKVVVFTDVVNPHQLKQPPINIIDNNNNNFLWSQQPLLSLKTSTSTYFDLA